MRMIHESTFDFGAILATFVYVDVIGVVFNRDSQLTLLATNIYTGISVEILVSVGQAV
jgi:hypothetical protein